MRRARALRIDRQLRRSLVVELALGQFFVVAQRVVADVAEHKARPLLRQRVAVALDLETGKQPVAGSRRAVQVVDLNVDAPRLHRRQHGLGGIQPQLRAEESGVGNRWGRSGKSRWSPVISKKQSTTLN